MVAILEENIKILESFKNDIDNLTPEDYDSLPVEEALKKLIKGYKEQEKIIANIREEFLKYDWINSNNIQIYNQLKNLYESIF